MTPTERQPATAGACPAERGGKMADCAAYPACACDHLGERTMLDDISDYVRPRPADLGAIAKQIGMTPSNAFWAVAAAEERGKIRRGRYGLYEACN